MKAYLLLVVLTFLNAPAAAANERYYREDGTEIRYYLDNAEAENLLVIFQGSDCNSVRHMKSVNTIWEAFDTDSALLTIEKYGIDDSLAYASGERDDCPADYLKHDTMAQRIKDGVQLIEALRPSYREITLAGGSEGGSIAIGVAAQTPNLHAVLALNSGSSSFQHDVEFSIQQTVPTEQLDEVLNGFRQFVKQVKESNEPFPIEVSGHGYAFWKDALARDLLQPLREIDAPVLVMQSADDESVDPERTRQEVKKIIAGGAKNVTLKMMPGLDHGFRDSSGASRLREQIEYAAAAVKTKSSSSAIPFLKAK
ncbi:prolyl oligopeptidase family serine peptidase [Idiomarina sp. FenBw--71]|nr:prolyl oligopeptidase family serine peptidase [Idiomarina sp. FeN1]NCU58665.1 prolyl oligopeptidase family serine peptidase [Idiomarina sp. FenA--70]NCU61361.1 prolyl oligopeptidase family serine peptidase [Idiomarina sp. FenBw--71]UUN15063.1 prolyl oligopeptidase family serine peptidase [Idiomarina loihiensis]